MGKQDDRQDLEKDAAREGVFDAQLYFTEPFVEPPRIVKTIIKRDGREVPFETAKIAETIFKAAQSVGGEDRDLAASLASGVAIYLAKKLNGEPPTVEQVQDAVEKVLIELGHARTALAYARYRDKRARLRKLRQGDVRGLLRELDEAYVGHQEPGGASAPTLFVRTSEEALAAWDRDRIVDALVRETGLDVELARVIALEVEQQILAANVKTLTTSLVRELVDSKLIEHGREESRRRHARLGVPLYDTEQIICVPGRGAREGAHDPEATNVALAERVKKEFALSQVFTQEVADAHLRGDVHLHGLGFIDRLHSSVQSLECVKKFGANFAAFKHGWGPADTPEGLLYHLGRFHGSLQAHFSGVIAWEAFNVLFAPLLADADERMLNQYAGMTVFELGGRGASSGVGGEVEVCWAAPKLLEEREGDGHVGQPFQAACGPDEDDDEDADPRAEYSHAAQQFAWALLNAYGEGGAAPSVPGAPVLCVRLTGGFFRSPGSEAFLAHAAGIAAARGTVHFVLDRDESPKDNRRPTWAPREVVAHEATINLPRAAFRSQGEDALYGELDRLVACAVQAHVEKRNFIERLLALRELGPLSMLGFEHEGQAYLDLDRTVYRVGTLGLDECVEALSGKPLHESDEALALGLRIMTHLARVCTECGEAAGLRLVLAQTTGEVVSRRLAALDLREFPDQARAVVKTDPLTHDIQYTLGARMAARANLSPADRVFLEGRFHEAAAAGASTEVHMPDSSLSGESLAAFVKKAYYDTRNVRLVFRR